MARSLQKIAIAATGVTAICISSAFAASFTFTPLVLPNSISPAYVTGIYQDQAVGWGTASGANQAGFVWSAGNYTLLPSIPQIYSVSDNGLALGYASPVAYSIYNLTTSATRTFAFAPAGGNGFIYGAINAAGTVVATQQTDVGKNHRPKYYCRPFTQDTSGNYVFLSDATKPMFVATGLADNGTVLASAANCPFSAYNPDIYKNGKFRPYKIPGGVLIQVYFVNGDAGFGGSYENPDVTVGYTSTGGKATTYQVPGSAGTIVTGMDGHGKVAGFYLDASGAYHGFIVADKIYHTIDYPGHKYSMITGFSTTGAIIGYFGDSNAGGQLPDQPFIATCLSDKGCTS